MRNYSVISSSRHSGRSRGGNSVLESRAMTSAFVALRSHNRERQRPRLHRARHQDYCAHLTIGAKICGPPAIDREFGTIDFLTLLDLHALPALVRAHFLR